MTVYHYLIIQENAIELQMHLKSDNKIIKNSPSNNNEQFSTQSNGP